MSLATWTCLLNNYGTESLASYRTVPNLPIFILLVRTKTRLACSSMVTLFKLPWKTRWNFCLLFPYPEKLRSLGSCSGPWTISTTTPSTGPCWSRRRPPAPLWEAHRRPSRPPDPDPAKSSQVTHIHISRPYVWLAGNGSEVTKIFV